jgi:ribulose-5-phosphate 4-epimerase/fuculose-1-phosphate aldolase
MSLRSLDRTTNARPDVSDAEWQIRCDLAACYQLMDLYGMSDLFATHLSARVPGPDHHFLLNDRTLLFDEITASSLLKVDMDGNLVSGSSGEINSAGFIIHSAIHMNRPELACVLHSHTAANNAVAMLKEGLLPISQAAMIIMGFVSYHDYEGVADNLDERARIANCLGPDGHIIILRNHGSLTVGRTVAEAFVWMYRLEAACRFQVAGLSCGRPIQTISDDGIRHAIEQGKKLFGRGGEAEPGMGEWASLLQKLERERGESYRS